MNRLSRLLVTLGALVVGLSAIAVVSANGAGGVTGPAFYVDGELYRTVGTPTDLSGTGAPDHSFETIYDIPDQPNVAEAGPGMPGFNGGRWMVRPVSFNTDYATTVAAHDTNGSGDLDSNEEVESALTDAGDSGATLVLQRRLQGGTPDAAQRAARRFSWERLARSLRNCTSASQDSRSAGPNRSLGSISRTTRYTCGRVI